VLTHEDDGLAAGTDDRAYEIALFSAISTVVTPTTLSSGGSTSLAMITARYLFLNFDHSGSVIGTMSTCPESSAAMPSPKPPVLTNSASSGL
jgi:hypothetical protein